MGYDRIILIVAVVLCRTAVLQVLSQTTNPGITKPITLDKNSTATESPNVTGTTGSDITTYELGCQEIFPHCSSCNRSDSDTWVCYMCTDDDVEPDDELCIASVRDEKSQQCCKKEPEDDGKLTTGIIIGVAVGGFLVFIVLVIVIVAICHRQRKRRKRSRAEPPRPPPVNTNTVHTDADGTRYRLDRKGNKVFDVDDPDIEMNDRPPLAPPLDVPHPPSPEDFNQVYDNDLDQVRIENTGRQPRPPRIPGQLHLQKPPLPLHQKPLKSGEPPRAPPPVPVKNPAPASALRPPNPPPKPSTSPSHQRSKPQVPTTKPKPAVPKKIVQTSPSPPVDFQDTYEIPDADKQDDFGETYDDVASDNNAFDWQESYDDVSGPHQDQHESDGEDYEPVPKSTSPQSKPQSPFAHITQESIIKEYGDDKLYQNQPVLDSKTKTSYRYRNLAMTKGEKIESEAPYLVKR